MFTKDFVDRASVVLVDISPEQIAKSNYADETILGNIEEWCRPSYFDVVCTNNVLEHVDDASKAIERMAVSVRSGGLLVISGPMRSSVQGWLTRLTPHAFHVWFYRNIQRMPHAGEPGYAPFPVKFSGGAAYRQIVDILTSSGFEIIISARYPGTHTRMLLRRRKAVALGYLAFCGALKAATFGQYQPLLTDFFVVAQKTERATADTPPLSQSSVA